MGGRKTNTGALLNRAGIRLHWSREEAEECRRHHAAIAKRWHRNHGSTTKDGRSPTRRPQWYYDSIARLAEYGYAQTDIAVMVGISRQRVKQIIDSQDIDLPYYNPESETYGSRTNATLRLWDDDSQLFVPVTPEEYAEMLRGFAKSRAAARRRRSLRDRRREHVDAVRHLGEKLGRPPAVVELGEYLWPEVPNSSYGPLLSHYWRARGEVYNTTNAVRSHSRAMDVLWRCAGYRKRTNARTLRDRFAQ